MKNCVALFVLLTAQGAFATSVPQHTDPELTEEMARTISGLPFEGSAESQRGQAEARLRNFFGKIEKNPRFTGNPDELRACVTKTKCVGQGEEKVCDSWEVCVSSD